MFKKRHVLSIIFCLFCITTKAQQLDYSINQDSLNTWQLIKYDTNNTWKSVTYSFTSPLDWKGKDFVKLGSLIGGTILLSSADREFENFIDKQRSGFPKGLRDFGWYFGSPQNYFMANAGLYSFGLITKNNKIRRTSILIISSSITSGFLQSLSKTVLGRGRPSAGFGSYDFNPFSNKARFHSFPSGHTVLSITMSHAIAKQFSNIWMKTGIYVIGAIPPISRLIDGAHWLTDIAFGTALSIIVVDGIDKFLYKNNAYGITNSKRNKISWNLAFGTNTIGLIGTF